LVDGEKTATVSGEPQVAFNPRHGRPNPRPARQRGRHRPHYGCVRTGTEPSALRRMTGSMPAPRHQWQRTSVADTEARA